MRAIALILCALAGSAVAESWELLESEQIEEALSGKKIVYDTAWQEFYPSYRTLYNAGRDSWGYWAVRDDQYCSQWPPNAEWACYSVSIKGDQIRFSGAFGDVSDGTIVSE